MAEGGLVPFELTV